METYDCSVIEFIASTQLFEVHWNIVVAEIFPSIASVSGPIKKSS